MAEFDAKEGGLNQLEARSLFIKLIGEEVPKAIDELMKEPLTLLKQVEINGIDAWENIAFSNEFKTAISRTPEELMEYHSLFPREYTLSLCNFITSYRKWAQTYYIDVDWVLEGFANLMSIWIKIPKFIEDPKFKKKKLEVALGGSFPVVSDDLTMPDGTKFKYEFEYQAWRFNEQRETSYREAIEEAFQKSLSAYLKKIGIFAESQEYKRTPKTRKRDSRTPIDRMRLLVLYQVKGSSKRSSRRSSESDVLEKDKPTDKMTSQSLDRNLRVLADLIGIKLRPDNSFS